MLSIGEFSHSTMLSVKTLRYYQELGILIPAKTDEISGYRFYDRDNFERARSIVMLKDLGFTLKEISEILDKCENEDDLRIFIEEKLNEIEIKLKKLKGLKKELQKLKNSTASSEEAVSPGINEFSFELPCYASMELCGPYHLVGKGFAALYKKYGRYSKGKPYTFYCDIEHKEGEARMEAVVTLDETAGHRLSGTKSFKPCKAVKMVYNGPYGGQGPVYMELFNYCRDRGYIIKAPIIEHYVKGPGIVFKGNPEKYQTECILLIDELKS